MGDHTPSSEALADPERGSERPDHQTRGWGRQHHCDRRPIRPQACPQGPSPGTASAVRGLPGLSSPPAAGVCAPLASPLHPQALQTRGSWWSRSQQQSHTCSFSLFPPVAGKMAFALRTVTDGAPRGGPFLPLPAYRFPKMLCRSTLVSRPAIDFSLLKGFSAVYLFIQDYFIIMSY